MTTTLSPELTKIYSKLLLNGTKNIHGLKCLPEDTYDFPIAEKRDDDIMDHWTPDNGNNDRERYRYLRATKLIEKYLKNIDNSLSGMICVAGYFDPLHLFYLIIDKYNSSENFETNLRKTVDKELCKKLYSSLNHSIGHVFDINVSDLNVNYFSQHTSIVTEYDVAFDIPRGEFNKLYEMQMTRLLSLNAKVLKRDGCVHPSKPKLDMDLEERKKLEEMAKDILESENVWEAFCSSQLFPRYQSTINSIHVNTSRVQYTINKWFNNILKKD